MLKIYNFSFSLSFGVHMLRKKSLIGSRDQKNDKIKNKEIL